MKKCFLFSLMLLLCSIAHAAPEIILKKGLVITQSVIIKKQNYFLDADASFKVPLIIIEGSNIIVDFNQSVLQSNADKTMPDKFYGLAILIKKGSSNIVIKNANIHGCKIALMADSTEQLTVDNCNFSFNYRQHIHSNLWREDISDWMSYHHNENDEWMRYGAGMYLKDCNNAVIKNNTITNGQCGLMMMRCNGAEVSDNNFSFNSGIGIGLYRSSNNKIYHNLLCFNVRGFSDGIYYRGQDSAGILVFEQCNNNLFAYNTATHSGDGFFLWAGQYTMDTGKGGCNDNYLYGNDFSFAPTNGVELTFSKNRIEKNIIEECDHGIWGGYSFQSSILENQISRCRIGVAIEHGQNNEIAFNQFKSNKTSIKLWSRTSQPPDWGYAKYMDTKSTNYNVVSNNFNDENIVYDIMGTDSLWFNGNKKINCNQSFKLGERIKNLDTSGENFPVYIIGTSTTENKMLASVNNKSLPESNFPRSRSAIRISEWGPYNFEYPLLWLKKIDSAGLYYFEVLAKSGSWKLAATKGFSIISKSDNNFPSTITAKADSTIQNRLIQLVYNGEAFIDMFGNYHKTNSDYSFAYKEFDAQTKWQINFYKWNADYSFENNFQKFNESLTQPVYTTTVSKPDYTWWGSIGKNLPEDSFATVATSVINLPDADYEIGITCDDLAKLFMDGKEIINAWSTTYTALDENTHHSLRLHLSGKHEFKIVHAEITGIATLMFYLQPVSGN